MFILLHTRTVFAGICTAWEGLRSLGCVSQRSRCSNPFVPLVGGSGYVPQADFSTVATSMALAFGRHSALHDCLFRIWCAYSKVSVASAYHTVCGRETDFSAVGIYHGQPHCTVDYNWYTPQVFPVTLLTFPPHVGSEPALCAEANSGAAVADSVSVLNCTGARHRLEHHGPRISRFICQRAAARDALQPVAVLQSPDPAALRAHWHVNWIALLTTQMLCCFLKHVQAQCCALQPVLQSPDTAVVGDN